MFDTNALISAHIKEGSVSAKAYDRAFEKGVLVVSWETFEEFATRFSQPKFKRYQSDEDRAEVILRIKRLSLTVEPKIEVKVCSDPDDDKFLNLALAVTANCIVTGDKKLLILHPFQGIPILSPADFLNQF